MRFVRHRVFIPAAAVAASTAFAACHRADSILLVEVAGDLSITPSSLSVAVDPSQTEERTFQVVPKDGAAITLPASLSVEMAPNLTGPVTVAVDAISSAGFVIAAGTATQQDINVGGETIVVVTLVSGSTPPVDADSDAILGTGGSGGTGGAPRSGGQGTGGSGTGGAGGKLDAGGDA